MDLSSLYQQTILEHAKHPRHAGRLSHATHHAFGKNPLCGDSLEVMLVLEEDRIAELSFVGEGCAISQASASLMAVTLQGVKVADAKVLLASMVSMLTEDGAQEHVPPRLQVLSGVKEFPTRIKCALLAWRALEAAFTQKRDVTTEDA